MLMDEAYAQKLRIIADKLDVENSYFTGVRIGDMDKA